MANRLLDLQQAKAAALDNADGLLAKLNTEKRAAMTTEEQIQFDGFLSEAESIQRTIDATQRFTTVRPQAITGVTSNIPSDRTPAATSLSTGEADSPWARIGIHDNHLDKPWGPEPRSGESATERRRRLSQGFGEYLFCVRTAEVNRQSGRAPDARLMALNEDFEKRAIAAGSSEAVPSDGGFLVYPDFAQEVMMLAHETGLIYPRTRQLPLSEYTNAIKIPAIDEQSRKDGSRWGGVQAFWENEGQALVGTKPTIALLEMITKKLTGLYYATNEVLADARLLGSLAMQAFGEEFGFKLDDGCIRGTGAGQLLGILNAKCTVSVPKEASQASGSATIVYENIKNMWSRMWNKSRANAVWFIEQDCEPQLFALSQTVGTGGIPVYLPPGVGGALYGGATEQPYARLFGRPVVTVEQCSTVGTVGDIILADWKQYLMIDKGDVQTASSAHVRFLSDEMTYRFILRVDGAPWWKVPLTPANGTHTRSPFVTLATR